jgi:hypothetical protein
MHRVVIVCLHSTSFWFNVEIAALSVDFKPMVLSFVKAGDHFRL